MVGQLWSQDGLLVSPHFVFSGTMKCFLPNVAVWKPWKHMNMVNLLIQEQLICRFWWFSMARNFAKMSFYPSKVEDATFTSPPLVNVFITNWFKSPFSMGKLTNFRLGHGFHSQLLVYQRVTGWWYTYPSEIYSIFMVIFHSYVKWPEGNWLVIDFHRHVLPLTAPTARTQRFHCSPPIRKHK